MTTIIILLFVFGYLAIAFEHPLKLDKSVSALLMAALIWAFLSIGFQGGSFDIINTLGEVFNFSQGEVALDGFENTLLHHLGSTAEILLFLIGAMTIVEIIDLHNGFDLIKKSVKTKSKRKLLWIVGILGFFLSAVIDNLTATIVLVTLIGKLVQNRDERIWYASLIVLAANSGGAWSPIGDVTTTMLWIGKRVTAPLLVEYLVIPSIISFAIPFAIASYLPVFRGNLTETSEEKQDAPQLLTSKLMLFLGIGMIVSVPVFKAVTGLPPYLGMMLSLGVVWLVAEYSKPEKPYDEERKAFYTVRKALSNIDMASILFFFGILMAVAGLEALVYGSVHGEEVGTLRYAAEMLEISIPNQEIVILLLGVLSAIVDNVPLVAATMGMYDFPIDHEIWHFIAYSAGTGGSMLIIGSAAGVAAMGMERIDFIWYLKKISWLAFIGFITGAGTFLLIENVIFPNMR